LQRDANKKKEEKIKELQGFIHRFSANASKSKQATSRKKQLDKITLEDLRPSNRKYPFLHFKPEREAGKQLLTVDGITKSMDGEKVLDNVSFVVNKGDKIAFVGPNGMPKTTLFQVITGETEADAGEYS
ncbi:ATP-binding cassette domain-containing protein, partial [Clostridium perfringens]